MIDLIKIRPLIYEERSSISDFDVDIDDSIDCILYDELLKIRGLSNERPSSILNEQFYIDIFNDAYFIMTLALIIQRPEQHIEDVFVKIAIGEDNNEKIEHTQFSIRSWAVMGMVLAMLTHLYKSLSINSGKSNRSICRLADCIQIWFDEGDQNKQDVAKSMCKAVLSVSTSISKKRFCPCVISSYRLNWVNWDKYITFFDVNDNLFIGGPEIEEILNLLGVNLKEKLCMIESLKHHIKKIQSDNNQKLNRCVFDSAYAGLEYWEIKFKNTMSHKDEPGPKQLNLMYPNFVVEEDSKNRNLLTLTGSANTERAQKYFRKSIKKGWIIQKTECKFEWSAFKTPIRGANKTAWAYFIAKVYLFDYDSVDKNTDQLSRNYLENLFSMPRGTLGAAFTRIRTRKKLTWQSEIDLFFEE